MKVLLLADANSIHTRRWAVALAARGIRVAIFSLTPMKDPFTEENGITMYGNKKGEPGISDSGLLRKSEYLTKIPVVWKCIREFKPDILHSHYASSYGILGAMSGFHPFVLSVWGSDVYDFPKQSLFTRIILRHNLKKADRLLSTSHIMAVETGKYTPKEVTVVPFGIDTEVFRPLENRSTAGRNELVIGTVKALETIYGIDVLLNAFAILRNRHPELPLRLVIVGGGTQKEGLKALSGILSITDRVTFTGKVPHTRVPAILNTFDLFVALSHKESFGVALLEASACQLPVVATDIEGFREVVENNVTGILIPAGNPEAAATAMEKLILDAGVRAELGSNGRENVIHSFNWNDNVEQMLSVYTQILR
jgi:L-malate glycosyltransferase